MTETGNNEAEPKRVPGAWLRKLAAVASIGLMLVAGVDYLDYLRGIELVPNRFLLPLGKLVVSPELKSVASLPSQPGALSGQNLLIVTLDTTRPDRLGCYGNEAPVSPNLDRLARDGVVFSNAVAVASSTLPTHASIMTGLYPHHHGAPANSVFRVDDRNQTLAERLSAHGYETAAFVSAFVLDARFGLNQGFGHYDDSSMQKKEDKPFSVAERKADETTDKALEWLRFPRRGPFFLWVHYYDPHMPHEAPAPFEEAHHGNPYDAEIAFVDQQLGRLLAEIESAPGPGTLVVVGGDHGEALGEHGEQTHSLLVQEATLRIPLVMRAADGLSGGFHVGTRVSQVDLMPTLLSMLGVGASEEFDGMDLTLAQKTPDAPRLVLAETIEGRVSFGWARLTALYRGAHKYVDASPPELYDLDEDPLERNNLAMDRAGEKGVVREQIKFLARQLGALRGDPQSDSERSGPSLDSDDIEMLEALGYLVPDAKLAARSERGPNPTEMMPLMSRLHDLINSPDRIAKLSLKNRALDWISEDPWPGSPDEVLRALEKMAADHPDFSPALVYLEKLYNTENRPEEAQLARERLERFFQPVPPIP